MNISIGGVPCAAGTWFNDGLVSCATSQLTVGYKNVTLWVANRSAPTLLYDFEELVVAVCPPAFYGVVGETCLGCPVGAACPGGELSTDLVRSLPGFWRVNVSAPSAACAAAGRQGRTEFGCPVLQACSPAGACLGNNTCATGYTGSRCATCQDGYFNSNGACAACPSSPFAAIIIFIVAALAACALSYGLTKAGLDLPLLTIGIDYAQVIAVFAQTSVQWPTQITSLYTILSAFNLNLDLVRRGRGYAQSRPP